MFSKTERNSNKICLLVIDMVKDNFEESKNLPITKHALKIIHPINKLGRFVRNINGVVVYSTDYFNRNDFIFSGKMKPHSIAGTEGANLIDDLEKLPQDKHFRKPSFSAFFKTSLLVYLKEKGVSKCLVSGVATQICVLSTVLDSIANNFETVLLSDCSASYSKEAHELTLRIYERTPLYPLLKVTTSEEFMNEKQSYYK